jgi:hypothetical protein
LLCSARTAENQNSRLYKKAIYERPISLYKSAAQDINFRGQATKNSGLKMQDCTASPRTLIGVLDVKVQTVFQAYVASVVVACMMWPQAGSKRK